MSTPPRVFDRPLIARRQARRDNTADFVTTLVIDDLGHRLAPITRHFDKALIMGPDPEWLPRAGRAGDDFFVFERVSTLISREGFASVDPEALALPGTGYTLIVSLLDLQTVNDVPGFLDAVRRHLAPDGLFMAAAIGGRTLTELRDAWLAADVEQSGGVSPRVAPMIDVRDAGGLLQRAGFALPVADLETHTVRYPDPLALFAELHDLGAANPLADRSKGLTTPRRLMRAAEIYAERFSDPDGRVRATLEILWLLGWAPHESQQKPLKPGSATVSLKDVLEKKT